MKIQNPYRTGLFAGLGVITALVIGGAIGSLATILTWVGAALFLALGLDPLVTWLEKHKVKRPVAILITLVGVLGVFVGLVFALIPVIVEQVGNLVTQISEVVVPGLQDGSFVAWVKDTERECRRAGTGFRPLPARTDPDPVSRPRRFDPPHSQCRRSEIRIR